MKGLSYILKLEGITVNEFANYIDVAPSLVYRWLNGKKPLPEKRLKQITNMFPAYPEKYFDTELSDADKVYLDNLKYELNIADKEAESPLIDMKKALKQQVFEQQQVIDEINSILDIKTYNDMSDVENVSQHILLTMLAMVSQEQSLLTHDYDALNKLEKMRKEQINNRSSALFLITVVMSALCEAFGIKDKIESFVFTPSMKIMDNSPDNMIQDHIDIISERRNDLITIFRNIIDECNENDAAKETINKLLNGNK